MNKEITEEQFIHDVASKLKEYFTELSVEELHQYVNSQLGEITAIYNSDHTTWETAQDYNKSVSGISYTLWMLW